MTRIEIVGASREVFGADRSAVRLARLLGDLGAEVRLTVPASRPELGLDALAAESAVAMRPGPVVVASSRGLEGASALARRRDRAEVDLAIYNSAAVAARPGDRRPRVLVLREWLDPKSRRHRLLSAWHGRRTDAVIAVSEGVGERWRQCVPVGPPVEVIPNWLDEQWLSLEPGPRGREGILFCGRLNSWKGHLMLADAFDQAFARATERPSLTFIGAEPSPRRFHRNAVELARRCKRSGWTLLPVTAAPQAAFARAALAVVPSLRPEPFGNVILEALAAGLRVVAFPGGGVDDLASLFGDAIEVVPRDERALADALARWWRDGGLPLPEAERTRVTRLLRDRFTAAAAALPWARVLERFS